MDLTNGWISEWMNAEWNIRWMMKALCSKKRCVRYGKMNAQFENEWMNEWMLNKCFENRLEMYQN